MKKEEITMENETQILAESISENLTNQTQSTHEAFSSEEGEKSKKTKSQPKFQKESGYKVMFEGEAAEKLLWLEGQLRERSAKPEIGQILGKEILNFEDQRWSAIVEENTEIDYFFSQIRKIKDKPKALKLLKGLSEKLLKENEGSSEESAPHGFPPSTDVILLASNKSARKRSSKLEDQTTSEVN